DRAGQVAELQAGGDHAAAGADQAAEVAAAADGHRAVGAERDGADVAVADGVGQPLGVVGVDFQGDAGNAGAVDGVDAAVGRQVVGGAGAEQRDGDALRLVGECVRLAGGHGGRPGLAVLADPVDLDRPGPGVGQVDVALDLDLL